MRNILKTSLLIILVIFHSMSSVSANVGDNNKISLEDELFQNKSTNDLATVTDDVSIFGFFIQVVLALLFIGALIYLLVKFLSVKNRLTSINQPIKIIGTVPLTPQKSVRVVELGKSLYFLGVGDDITLLQKIDDEEEIELIKLTVKGTNTSSSFSKILKSKMLDIKTKRHSLQEQWLDHEEDRDWNENEGNER